MKNYFRLLVVALGIIVVTPVIAQKDNVGITRFLGKLINLKYPNYTDKEKKDIFYKYLKAFSSGEGTQQGSDKDIDVIDYDDGLVTISVKRKPELKYERKTGAYFKWYHKLSKIDLSRYQVYRQDQNDKNSMTCLIHALHLLGVDVMPVLSFIALKSLNIYDITMIAKSLNITINLTSFDEKSNKKGGHGSARTQIINKGRDIYNIGLIKGHYFINEMTNISKYAISNYYDCMDHSLFPSIAFDGKYRKATINSKHKCLTSFDVIRFLFDFDHLDPITMENCDNNTTEKLLEYETLRAPRSCGCEPNCNCAGKDCPKLIYCGSCNYSYMCKDCIRCNYEHNEYRPYWKKGNKKPFKGFYDKPDPNDDFDLIYADFETFHDYSVGYHIPYCLCYKKYSQFNSKLSYDKIKDLKSYEFYGLSCAEDFLKSLTRDSVIITHNLGFDFKMMQDHLTDLHSCIESGTKIKTISARYGKLRLVFKDNYAFLNYPLAKLTKIFKLETGDKDVYPYSLINSNNLSSLIPLNECLEHVTLKQDFIDNANKLNCITNNFVDIKKYTIHYCHKDVDILASANLKFRDQILKISDEKIDIISYISLPQVADDYFRNKKCYDGCYKISGIAHDFIRRCIVGGRVMVAYNKKTHVKELINDFDAVSLYPSAMYRFPGYLKGLPKVIKTFEPDKYDHYFVEIKINSIKKCRAFPLVSIRKNMIHNFTNDLLDENIYVDKTTLEDLIKWQDVEYTFIRGYYFDEGYNPIIKDVIKKVFDKRIEEKKKKNPIQESYKLIMNSSYGKLCQKPIKRDIVFKDGNIDNNMEYLINNFDQINEFVQVSDKLIKIVKQRSICMHFAPVHMACQVLSMSKRIMNEVMCLAEDNNIKIFYQDTDSMHILDEQISKLSNIFKETYDRELIGENMGQFHTDFDIKDCPNATNIIAVESIFLGKKCYIDRLQYDNNGIIKEDYHIRMKGIPSKCVENPMETYMVLYNGATVEFDLLKYCPLKKTKSQRMVNNIEFKRKIKFC